MDSNKNKYVGILLFTSYIAYQIGLVQNFQGAHHDNDFLKKSQERVLRDSRVTASFLPSTISPLCFFRYTHSNEGLGGSFNQLLIGKYLAAIQGLEFCMASEQDLLDPWEISGHVTDNAWLRKYWYLPPCPTVVHTCDVSYKHRQTDWELPFVWRMYQLLYKEELAHLSKRIEASPLNENFEYCAHVRTGDSFAIPIVQWTGVKLYIFGAYNSSLYPFCATNKCIDVPKTKDVEFDFVNMANCKNLAACDSSLSITAKLLNRYNKEYVKVARVSNIRFTEFFNGFVYNSSA